MPDYRRIKVKGGTYFFTVVTFGRQPILINDRVRTALREGIQEVRQSLPFGIEAWVLLPDHLHTIWTLPENDDNFASRWAVIKRSVSRLDNFLEGSEGPAIGSHGKRSERRVWQRRFWEHLLRDELDFQRHLDYLHWNPVKHGYVRRVIDWPYSTFHRFVAKGLYAPDWGGTIEEKVAKLNFGE
ncbi:MAG: REP-associated tyrosine transposase [Desulfobaccales bacterium]